MNTGSIVKGEAPDSDSSDNESPEINNSTNSNHTINTSIKSKGLYYI